MSTNVVYGESNALQELPWQSVAGGHANFTPNLAARSRHGCWTCRLRKKKCDESHPSCLTCTSLELHCHGYGPKPKWMDRGVLEKEQSLKVKRFLSEVKSKKRERLLRTSQNQNRTQDLIFNRKASSIWVHETAFMQHGDSAQRDSSSCSIAIHSSTLQEEMSCEPFGTLQPESNLEQDIAVAVDGQFFLDHATSIGNWDGELNTPITSSFGQISTLVPGFPSTEAPDADWYSARQLTNAKSTDTAPELVSNTSCLCGNSKSGSLPEYASSALSSSKRDSYTRPLPHEASKRAVHKHSPMLQDTDDILFMHYLDQVFHIQYPFYLSSYHQDRGWLFSILRRYQPAYHAVLALSAYHRHSIDSSDPGRLRVACRHYDMALREIQLSLEQAPTWFGTTGISRGVEGLSCIVQLIFWELFNGSNGNWQIHLHAAATFVLVLAQSYVSSPRESSIQTGSENAHPRSEEDSAIQCLLGTIISIDIMSAVSTRSCLVLPLDHKLLLEDNQIKLETITGCENWAMSFIVEISLFDEWRKGEEKAGKLSLVEVVTRGRHIQERIEEKLADLENIPSTEALSGNTMQPFSASICTEITRIFALSAITYLHVVVSGAYPRLPEIMQSVSKTVTAFQRLTEPKLLRHLVWPFCISGCLAAEEQYDSIRELFSAAEATESTIGTFSEAYKIIQECWETRVTIPCNRDWATITSTRYYPALLY